MINSSNDKLNGENKVILVTGAARRVGAVIAEYFHQLGYNVILHFRKSSGTAIALQTKLNTIRHNSAHTIHAELGELVNPELAEKFVSKAMQAYGRLDILVNNASTFFATPVGTVNLNQWRDLMISNVGGPFFLIQAFVENLKLTQGCIINISDIHAKRPLKNHAVYNIAKTANDMLTKTLAKELAPDIRVNGVAPGPMIWPESEELNAELKQKILDKTLLGRLNNPINIARTVAFLAENNDITGQIITVDGGRSLKD